MSMRASWSTLKRHKERQSVHCHTSQGVPAVHCHMSQGGPVSLQYLEKYFVVKKEQWVSNACNHNWQEHTQATSTDVCVTVQTSYRNGRGRQAVKVQIDQQLPLREKNMHKDTWSVSWADLPNPLPMPLKARSPLLVLSSFKTFFCNSHKYVWSKLECHILSQLLKS